MLAYTRYNERKKAKGSLLISGGTAYSFFGWLLLKEDTMKVILTNKDEYVMPKYQKISYYFLTIHSLVL